jgi:hypothetical protein
MHRLGASLISLALFATSASAVCPGDCVGGGGSPTNECVMQWGGIASDAPSCHDGDPACDADATADGVCTFALQACFGLDASCGAVSVRNAKVGPSKVPAAATLSSAIRSLAAGTCADVPVTVPVKRKPGAKPIKPGKTTLKVMVESEPGKDKDKLALTCLPSTPSFAADVQPIFTARCATAGGCHDVQANGGLVMLTGESYGDLVNAASASSKKVRVKPGSIPASLMARRLFGQDGLQMPSGCPDFPPPEGGCATDAEIYTLLSWIQNGAPNN